MTTVAPPLVLPILAIPLGIVPLPDAEAQNPALAALFAARMRADGLGTQRNPLCHHSRDDLLEWPEEPVRQLTATILAGLNSVVSAVNDFTAAQLDSFAVQARGWFTVVAQNGHVPA